MRKGKRLLKFCGRITVIAILMSLLKPYQVSAEQLTEHPPSLSEGGTKRYSDYEIEILIDDLTEAAFEAIEQAAGEAAKAAVLSMVEREAEALQAEIAVRREMERWRTEAEAYKQEIIKTKSNGIRNAIIVGLSCFIGGSILGSIIMK